MIKFFKLFIIINIFTLTACNNGSSDIVKLPDLEIASYKTLTGIDSVINYLSIKEFRQYVLSLPVNQRWNHQEPIVWYKELIKQLILEKQLLAEARLIGIEQQPEYLFEVRALLREAYTQQYISQFTDYTAPKQKDLEDYYSQHSDKYNLPEKRAIYHIFKSFDIKVLGSDIKAEEQITALRERVLNGENFKRLAEAHSDSESRHKKGLIGVLEAGKLSEDFDNIIFQLKADVPSNIVRTKQGFHIFYVDDILKEKSYTLTEVKNTIFKEVQQQQLFDYVKQKALLLPQPETFRMPSLGEFKKIRNRKIQSELLHVGGFILTTNQFIEMMNQVHVDNPTINTTDKAYQKLQEIAYAEVIYQHMQTNKIVYVRSAQLSFAKDKLLLKEFSKTKIKTYINQNPELIKSYYEKNKKRFSSSILVKLQLVYFPRENQQALMPLLEKSVMLLNSSKSPIEDLMNNYQGKLKTLPFKSAQQIASIDKHLLDFVFKLKTNEYSAPYTNETHYILTKLIDRKEAKIQPLSLVREQVVTDYIAKNQAMIFSKISQLYLKDLNIDETKLVSFIESIKIN